MLSDQWATQAITPSPRVLRPDMARAVLARARNVRAEIELCAPDGSGRLAASIERLLRTMAYGANLRVLKLNLYIEKDLDPDGVVGDIDTDDVVEVL